MSGWSEFAGQAASSLLGTLVGGLITIGVARWQTIKTVRAQTELAVSQQTAAERLARRERERERAADSARLLLERLADLYDWLPSLPDVARDQPVLSSHARQQCAAAMESIRRGMRTDLLLIGDAEIRDRYRTLVKLAYDVGWRGIGRNNRERQIRDVRHYLRYVQASLEAIADGTPPPVTAAPPSLDRSDTEAWLPPALPPHWNDPADGS